MRTLLASSDPQAAEAIDLFVFRAVREAAALVATMGGLDGLVFTAGIGEKSPQIRHEICERLSWLGILLDADASAKNLFEINASTSRVKVWVIPTDEELVIARHAFGLLA
jgi:acetate kinase